MLNADGFLLDAICWMPCFFEVSVHFVTLMAVMSKKHALTPSARRCGSASGYFASRALSKGRASSLPSSRLDT
jgi:hypothetical protein